MQRKIFLWLGEEVPPTPVDPAAELIVLVPGTEVVVTETSLPKLNAKRLRQTLPYALEEELLDEVDDLHFASGPYQNDQKIPVAIVKKSRMDKWLSGLQDAGLKASALLPLGLALPYQEKQWQVLIHGQHAEVRTGLYSCFSTELSNLDTLLALKMAESKEAPENIVRLEVDNLEDLSLLVESSLKNHPSINLLQTPYKARQVYHVEASNHQAWRRVGLGLTLCLALLALTPLLSFSVLKAQHYYYQHRISQLYQQHFPSGAAPKKPAEVLQRLYQNAELSEDPSLFLQWMGGVAKTASSVRLQAINFQNQQLILDLKAASFTHLDAFIAALKEEAFEVSQQSATLADNQVSAVLTLRRTHA